MHSLTSPPITTVFFIPPSVHLLDITGAAHVFYETASMLRENRPDGDAPLKLLFSTLFSQQTESTSTSMLAFHQLMPYDQLQLQSGDIVFVPGMDATLLLGASFMTEARTFRDWLKLQHSKGVLVCSVCTGAFLLGAAGLLDGRACTTHWKYLDRLKAYYPTAKVLDNRLFVQEDNIYTSAGVTSGIDLALYIVEQVWGSRLAAKVAQEIVIYFRRTTDDPQLNIFTQYRNHLDHRVYQVQDLLLQSLDRKLNLDAMAAQVSMSVRNLTRLFKKTTGITIGEYMDRLRAERAKKLIEEGQTIQAAAKECGLKSTTQLRQVMKRYV